MYVEEHNRAWISSNADNDHKAVTIEVANDTIGGNWQVSDKALSKLIELCVDICKRNSIKQLNFTGDKNGNLTMHKWFTTTNCPGAYLESKFPYIASEGNKNSHAKGLGNILIGRTNEINTDWGNSGAMGENNKVYANGALHLVHIMLFLLDVTTHSLQAYIIK